MSKPCTLGRIYLAIKVFKFAGVVFYAIPVDRGQKILLNCNIKSDIPVLKCAALSVTA